MSMKGKFIDFYLPYQDKNKFISARDQASSILRKAQALLTEGCIGVGILYSANYSQTLAIQNAYEAGHYQTGIRGANQAEVMMAMEDLLGDSTFQNLQGKIRIAPITTIAIGTVKLEDAIAQDLDQIQAMLDQGWTIFGWQNQNTVSTDHPYAIGGGIAILPATVSAKIQSRLKEFARDYS